MEQYVRVPEGELVENFLHRGVVLARQDEIVVGFTVSEDYHDGHHLDELSPGPDDDVNHGAMAGDPARSEAPVIPCRSGRAS